MLIFVIAFLVIIALLFYSESNEYWRLRGVLYEKKKPLLGILWDYARNNMSMAEIHEKLYAKYLHEKFVGIYVASTPTLFLKDPNLIREVLITHFNAFSSRGGTFNTDVDLLADNILFMEGKRWRLIRQKFTPVFTGAKLKKMFYILKRTGDDLQKQVKTLYCTMDQTFDPAELLNCFTTSAIVASVFGLDTSGNDGTTRFQKASKDVSGQRLVSNLKFIIQNVFPGLFKLLKIRIFSESQNFFIGMVKSVFHSRRDQELKSYDFLDTCLELQREGVLRDPISGYEVIPTDELMAAQAFFFFIAGVDPVAMTMNLTFYELAKNKNIFNTLTAEVDELFKKQGEDLTMEDIESMEYMDKVVNESLRMYPPISLLERKCVRDCRLSSGLTIEKDVNIIVPIYAMHRDERYYKNSDSYDPERFAPEKVKKMLNYTYLPFGEGNRKCIGTRYAKLQVKIGVAFVLRYFAVRTVGEIEPIRFEKTTFNLRPTNVRYRFVPRNSKRTCEE